MGIQTGVDLKKLEQAAILAKKIEAKAKNI
jgi:hypothetical protein